MASLCTGNYYPGLMSNAAQELEFLRKHIEVGLKFDGWWQDAGWYPCYGPVWSRTGTWEVDTTRFPKGLREVSDFVHSKGIKSIVWFEPERVTPGTWLADKHPEWVHGGSKGGLLKLGDPRLPQVADRSHRSHAHRTGHRRLSPGLQHRPPAVLAGSRFRGSSGHHRDPPRGGATSPIGTSYCDDIRACSSTRARPAGGETIWRRCVGRSHCCAATGTTHPDGQQCQTYGLSLWFPYQGTAGCLYGVMNSRYWMRSQMTCEFTFGPDDKGLAVADWDLLKSTMDEWRQINGYFLADFYPLTPYSLTGEAWMAWQYDRPASGEGLIQVFRRGASIYETARIPLRGLEPKTTYALTDLDTKEMKHVSGEELTRDGLPITIKSKPGSAIIVYRRIQANK